MIRLWIRNADLIEQVEIERHEHRATVPGDAPASAVVGLGDPDVFDIVVFIEVRIRLKVRLKIGRHTFACEGAGGAVGVKPHVRSGASGNHDQQGFLMGGAGHRVNLELDIGVGLSIERHLLVHNVLNELPASVKEVQGNWLGGCA